MFMTLPPLKSKLSFQTVGLLRGRFGVRTHLATPLLRKGVAIGAILIRRMEVRPFSEKQIKLLKTFADQAVIAIENVRLFQNSRNRWSSRLPRVKFLGVIARSPADIQRARCCCRKRGQTV